METTPNRGYPIPDDPRALFPQVRASLLVIDSDVDNLGSLTSLTNITIDADTDANGSGTIALRTRNLDRLIVNNNGTLRLPTDTTIALADPAFPGINFRNATTGIATTMEWWGGTGGAPGMPYDLGAYHSSVGAFYTAVELVVSNKRSHINGTIQGVSALGDGSEPSMVAVSCDVNGPALALETHGAMGVGFENQTILAGYDLDNPTGGGAGPYSLGYGNKRFAISSRGEMFWGPLVDDPAANATAKLTWDLDAEIGVQTRFRVSNAAGDAILRIDGKSTDQSQLVFFRGGTEKWAINQLNFIGANPWLVFAPPTGVNALSMDGSNGNTGIGQDPDANKLSVAGNILATGLLKAGSTPVTLTDAAGKILSAALNTVAVAQGGTGVTTSTGTGNNVLSAGPSLTGAVLVGGVDLSAVALNVYSGSAGTLAAFQTGGLTNGQAVLSTATNSVTGTIYALNANVQSSVEGYLTIQQNGNGNATLQAFMIGTGDPKTTYEVNGGLAWSTGIDNSDSDKFKIAKSSALDTNYYLIIDASGNVGVGVSTFGTSAAGVLAVANGTVPSTGPADTVQFYSSDDAAGHTIPSFYCEGTNVVATGQADSASSVRVKMRFQGVVRTFLCI